VLREARPPLDGFFRPRNVAVIGATESAGSVGRTLLWNLISNPFGGAVFPVNPKRNNVLGIKSYPAIAAVPEKVDLAVIVTPAATVPLVIKQCSDSGVNAAIVISAGFREAGPAGMELERTMLAEARRGKMRIIGPNCLGVMNPVLGLNATFAKGMAKPGNVALLSQSGALLTGILDWSFKEQVGFSAIVSTGSMLDVSWGDLIDYLGDDPHTKAILIYMESIGNARAFLSAAREVALSKPIIVIKAGRSEAAAKAAASHTGALTGSDEVLDAAFRRVGVLRVSSISEVFDMAAVLAKQPRPNGPRLTIVTNAGGPGVLATDALIAAGGELAPISGETIDKLSAFLPPSWSHANPIDILGDAGPQRYARALEVTAKDPNSDGLLVILTPQDMTDPTQTADHLKAYAKLDGKPILASWMGGPDIEAGDEILNRAGIPTFAYPDTAARAFYYMWKYTYSLRSIYETPALAEPSAFGEMGPVEATEIINAAVADGRTLLDEAHSKTILECYDIPAVTTHVARTVEEAVSQAKEIGFPVVLKLFSRTITHKTDVGGVKLNLVDKAQVARAFTEVEASVRKIAGAENFQGVTVQPMIKLSDAYELIVGSSIDPQFGPVLLFGSGGQLVEVFKDRALALPPLNATLARRMIEQTRIYHALKGVRGRKPINLPALEQLLVRFSQLVIEQPRIREIDINPLLASSDRLIALDARIVLHGRDVTIENLPKPAIRPYPSQYVQSCRLKDQTPITLRPICPEDEPLMIKFHEALSDESVRLRYFHPLKLGQRVAHERLTRVCFNDYDREIALLAEYRDGSGDERQIIGIGRLSKTPWTREAEVALLVHDRWQHRGLGTQLIKALIQVAKREGIDCVIANILPENAEMQQICEKAGFKLSRKLDESLVVAELRP
jgi:acetyltransferase